MAAPELLSDEGYRADGRRPAELRKIRARMGVFAQADGSAYIEQGNTKALAVVYGPHEVRGDGRRGLSGPVRAPPLWTLASLCPSVSTSVCPRRCAAPAARRCLTGRW